MNAMSWSLYLPLLLAAFAYAAISAAAALVAHRGDAARAERVRDAGFLLVLLAGAWVIVLVLVALFDEPGELWDMAVITLVVVAFFAVLLLALFAISLLVGVAGRASARRRRV